jgi:hypothetical protein
MRLRTGARVIVALAVTAVVAAALGVSAVSAERPPTLPSIGADALLASTITALASPPTVSGTVRTHVDLGLPALPDLPTGSAEGGATTPASALLGDQTFRIWRSASGIRVAHLGQFQEQVLVVNRTTAWAWDSQSLTAVRLTRGALASSLRDAFRGAGSTPSHAATMPESLGDPISIARTLLQGVRPYAAATMGTPQRVAGRDAYVLDLRPTSDRTLVGDISVAVDAATRLPLRIQVIPRGSVNPSIEVGFTSIDYGAIDPGMFSFVPPADARVVDAGPALNQGAAVSPAFAERAQAEAPPVRLSGKGFGLTIAVRVDRVDPRLRALLPYDGPLASATLVDRGDHSWIVAGAVTPAALAAAASSLH